LPGSPEPQPRTATENCPWTAEREALGIRGAGQNGRGIEGRGLEWAWLQMNSPEDRRPGRDKQGAAGPGLKKSRSEWRERQVEGGQGHKGRSLKKTSLRGQTSDKHMAESKWNMNNKIKRRKKKNQSGARTGHGQRGAEPQKAIKKPTKKSSGSEAGGQGAWPRRRGLLSRLSRGGIPQRPEPGEPS
jgi:hypothetical protein